MFANIMAEGIVRQIRAGNCEGKNILVLCLNREICSDRFTEVASKIQRTLRPNALDFTVDRGSLTLLLRRPSGVVRFFSLQQFTFRLDGYHPDNTIAWTDNSVWDSEPSDGKDRWFTRFGII